MTTQVNIRLEHSILGDARQYAKTHGYSNIQELIKECLRQKVYPETSLNSEEISLVKALVKATNEKGLWKSEKELFAKLRKKQSSQ